MKLGIIKRMHPDCSTQTEITYVEIGSHSAVLHTRVEGEN